MAIVSFISNTQKIDIVSRPEQLALHVHHQSILSASLDNLEFVLRPLRCSVYYLINVFTNNIQLRACQETRISTMVQDPIIQMWPTYAVSFFKLTAGFEELGPSRFVPLRLKEWQYSNSSLTPDPDLNRTKWLGYETI